MGKWAVANWKCAHLSRNGQYWLWEQVLFWEERDATAVYSFMAGTAKGDEIGPPFVLKVTVGEVVQIDVVTRLAPEASVTLSREVGDFGESPSLRGHILSVLVGEFGVMAPIANLDNSHRAVLCRPLPVLPCDSLPKPTLLTRRFLFPLAHPRPPRVQSYKVLYWTR